jgi:ATP-dependent DNA helicase RecG
MLYLVPMADAFTDDPFVVAARAAVQRIQGGARVDDLETATLDFKEEAGRRTGGALQPSQPKSKDAARGLAEEASCLANTDGGVLVVGVDDKATGPGAFIGTDLDSEWLRNRIWALTEPSLAVEVQPVLHNGVRLLFILVHRSYRLHRSAKEFKRRIGDSCVVMSAEDQRRAEEARTGYDWSAEPSTSVLADVSESAVEVARRFLRETGDPNRIALAARPTPEVLRALGVLGGDHDRLTNAGRVLFVAGTTTLVDFQRRTAPGTATVDRVEGTAPLLTAFEAVKARIDANNHTRELQLPSGVRPRIRSVPDRAVREALVNALMHRDYRTYDPVIVEMTGTQLVVSSPGGFPAGITTENIISERSHPRNAALTSVFRSLRLAEQEGVGVDRMFRDMASIGLALPTFADTGGRVRCVLVGGEPNAAVLELVSSLPEESQDDVDVILVLHALLDRSSVTAEGVSELLQKLPAEAADALHRGERFGLLQRTARSTRAREAFRLSDNARDALGPVLPYVTTSSEQAEEFVVRHLLVEDSIRASDLKDLLNVSSVQSSRILRELREGDVLRFGSEQTKGRGVFHVRGTAFGDALSRHGLSDPQA